MTRRERHEQVAGLRAQGLTFRQISERLGLAISTVKAAMYDPDGEKDRARKLKYSVPCTDCGAPLNGSDGNGPNAPIRCVKCSGVRNGAERKVWTREAILVAVQDWAREYGEPPAVPDWNTYSARVVLGDDMRAQRFECARGQFPTFTTVVREFGSWNVAIETAGFAGRVAHGGGGNVERRRRFREPSAA